MKKHCDDSDDVKFCGSGDDVVKYIRHDEKTKRLQINDKQYFENISEPIWNFETGGYKVLQHWLKERKKRKTGLSYEESIHFKNMVRAIDDTLRIMEKIDKISEEAKNE